MKSSVSQVHIGELIKSRAKAMRLGPTELGARIETSKQNIYGIFKRQSIDTELLTRISLALDYDFFTHLSQALGENREKPLLARKSSGKANDPYASSHPLERENAYLRRLNTLLEEKVASFESHPAAGK
ncbi:MAG: hypothetical protein IPN95_23050 [Bacteroidetes bacterium]|nr:hypothetical protein [Bacteroidota bacterium]